MSVKSSGTHEPRRRFARTGRQLFQHRLTGVRELPQAGSPNLGGTFLCTDPAGYANCVSVFVPDGRRVFR